MRILLTLNVLFFFFPFGTMGQSLPQFPADYQFNLPSSLPLRTDTTKLFVDTLIMANGLQYQRIKQTAVIFSGEQVTTTLGYYRVEGMKVYVLNNLEFDEETLQYDFAVEEGDSIYLAAPYNFDVDTVLYHINRKYQVACFDSTFTRYDVSYEQEVNGLGTASYQSVWIAGIGDLYHPFWDLACYGPLCEENWFNQYFTVNRFSATVREMGECEETLSNTEIARNQLDAVLSPNPFLRNGDQVLSLNVTGEAATRQSLTFALFDASGKLLGNLASWNNGDCWQLELPKTPLVSGIYWIRILGLQDVQPALRKLIVQ